MKAGSAQSGTGRTLLSWSASTALTSSIFSPSGFVAVEEGNGDAATGFLGEAAGFLAAAGAAPAAGFTGDLGTALEGTGSTSGSEITSDSSSDDSESTTGLRAEVAFRCGRAGAARAGAALLRPAGCLLEEDFLR